MSAFVLDTSIALKWFLEDENDRANSLTILRSLSDEHRPVVPWLWYYEIASVLLMQVHRKRVGFEEVEVFLGLIGEMAIDVDEPDKSTILGLPYLAREHRLTGYDAAFLELAKRLQLPLATSDKELIRAASESGVQLLTIPAKN
jgi:predicted nucleic acid-binding protein